MLSLRRAAVSAAAAANHRAAFASPMQVANLANFSDKEKAAEQVYFKYVSDVFRFVSAIELFSLPTWTRRLLTGVYRKIHSKEDEKSLRKLLKKLKGQADMVRLATGE